MAKIFIVALLLAVMSKEAMVHGNLPFAVDEPTEATDNLLALLGVSKEQLPRVTASDRQSVPRYTVQLYQLFSQGDPWRRAQGDLSSFILRAKNWNVRSDRFNLHFPWSHVLGETVGHAQVVLQQSSNCISSLPDGMSGAGKAQVCGDAHGCTAERMVQHGVIRIAEQQYVGVNVTSVLEEYVSMRTGQRDDHFTVHVQLTGVETEACILASDEPLFVVHSDPAVHQMESDVSSLMSQTRTTGRGEASGSRVRRAARGADGICSVHRWNVRFADLGWDTWIIQPNNFEAGVCRGDCTNDASPKTGHVFLRKAFKEKINSPMTARLPNAVCAATSMATMSVLFMDVNRTVIVKQLTDMVIDGCACI